MSRYETNPFIRFGLDPSATLAELTARLRELAEDASTDEERAAIRAAWDALSRSPARRLELVLEAGPMPSALMPTRAKKAAPAPWPEATLADVTGPRPLAPDLPPETEAERGLRAIDLSFLVREGEIEVSGPLSPRRTR